jgi:hypothetical protein
MIDALFVTKRFNTYADTFLMLGLARIAEYALSQTKQKAEMQLLDEGRRYRIQFKKSVNLEAITSLIYTESFPPVCGQKTDRSNIPNETIPFDTVERTKARKLYREYLIQNRGKADWREGAPPPPDPKTQNGVILTSMRHDRNHNDLWLQGWELRENYGVLVAALLQVFSQEHNSDLNADIKLVADIFKRQTGHKLKEASAVKIFLPTAVQGVSRIKADSNKIDPQKADWLSLWLIASGLFTFGISERVKVAERSYDWRVIALEPRDISFDRYTKVLDNLRKFNHPGGGHGIARFDAELVLRFCQELLKNHAAQAEERPEDDLDFLPPTNHFVRGFVGTHFGQKGQVYGVKELFTLGLPIWVRPHNYPEIEEYQTVLKEHLAVIISLSAESGQSELLAAYRNFITANALASFFQFQTSYAEFITRRLADSKARPPRLFSVDGLNLMTKNLKYRSDEELDLTKITQNSGFLHISKAINSATVYAGKISTKNGMVELDWQRHYGLAQRLSSQAGSKKEFVIELTAFLASYENENLRISEKLQKSGKFSRIKTSKDDLDQVIQLIEDFGSSLVANLLIAYGYAKWHKAESVNSEKQPSTNEQENSDSLTSDQSLGIGEEEDLTDDEETDNE